MSSGFEKQSTITNNTQALISNSSRDFRSIFIENKSMAWNELHLEKYQIIENAIKNAPMCSILPINIIQCISSLTVSICTVAQCKRKHCTNEIFLYETDFEIPNESQQHFSNPTPKEMRDYYLSDDFSENEIVFCKECVSKQRLVNYCSLNECSKIDICSNSRNDRFCSCGAYSCRRHSKIKCKQCGNSMCNDCSTVDQEYAMCNGCGSTDICIGCKVSCNGCDGTDSSHTCWYHPECVSMAQQCEICLSFFCSVSMDCLPFYECKQCESRCICEFCHCKSSLCLNCGSMVEDGNKNNTNSKPLSFSRKKKKRKKNLRQ